MTVIKSFVHTGHVNFFTKNKVGRLPTSKIYTIKKKCSFVHVVVSKPNTKKLIFVWICQRMRVKLAFIYLQNQVEIKNKRAYNCKSFL